jgi:hypothetical protein
MLCVDGSLPFNNPPSSAWLLMYLQNQNFLLNLCAVTSLRARKKNAAGTQ